MEPVRRFHAGWLYPVGNLITGSVLMIGMVLVGVISIGGQLQSHTATDRGTLAVGTGLTLLGFVVGVAIFCVGINGCRSVLLDATHLRLPTVSFLHFRRLDIPLDDIAGVEMSYCSAARNSRWRLMVIRLQHPNVYSDSLSSGRSRKRGIEGTTAARVSGELRQALPADRLSRWNLP